MKLIPASSARWMIADPRIVVGLPPGAEHHRAEAERTDMDTGAAERSLVHVSPRYYPAYASLADSR